MLPKAKILYFSVFILAVFAFIFHVTAMGHHHWKRASGRNTTETGFNYTSIGLFTRCVPSGSNKTETCFPNMYPGINTPCRWYDCIQNYPNDICRCDFSPSTKGIASCAIIASVFLGVAIIILFINSIKTTRTRTIDSILGFLPLLLLILAFIFILIALILVGSYLSRDMMQILRTNSSMYISQLLSIELKNFFSF